MKQITKNEIYKHYIALDWSKVNVALASIRDTGTKYKVVEHPPDLKIFSPRLVLLYPPTAITLSKEIPIDFFFLVSITLRDLLNLGFRSRD